MFVAPEPSRFAPAPPPASAAHPAPAAHHAPPWDALHRELRAIAARFLSFDRKSHTLQPTALVHEAYLRLHGSLQQSAHTDRLEFCRAAAGAMRRVLIDHARSRLRQKRGQGRANETGVELDELEGDPDPALVLELEDALSALEKLCARRAEVVRLRFYAGLEETEVAELLGIGTRTVQHDFRSARAWLRQAMDGKHSSASARGAAC